MGQQQLLLIALSVLIVGAAVAVGVNMFNEGAAQAEQDKYYQRAATLATEFGKWYNEPISMGGAGGSLPSSYDLNEFGTILGIATSADETDGLYMSGISAGANTGSYPQPGSGTTDDAQGIQITITDGSTEAIFVATENGQALWNQGECQRPGAGS